MALVQGKNDFKRIGYGGPCPPPGKPHRYFFRLYALDAKLDFKAGAGRSELERAIKSAHAGSGGIDGDIRTIMAALPSRRAVFRYYAGLNDFLPFARRFAPFAHTFELPASVKDMIESMGVPHTEVDLILVNGKPVDFSRAVQDGDRVSVYPDFQSLDTRPLLQLRTPLKEHRFVLDTHLGQACQVPAHAGLRRGL